MVTDFFFFEKTIKGLSYVMIKMARNMIGFRSIGMAVLVMSVSAAIAWPALVQAASPWDDRLDGIEQALVDGRYERAARKAESLYRKIAQETGSYERPAGALVRVLTYLAVAEEGVGERDAALWHLAMARTLERPGRRTDVSGLGPAGRFLAEVSHRHVGQVPPDWDDLPVDPFATPHMDDPFLRSDVADVLDYDPRRLPTDLEIEVLVDSDGRPHLPVLVVPTRFPGFAVAAMESMRQWRFEPAVDRSEGGEPVAALATVTVEFPDSAWGPGRQFSDARIPCGVRIE
jgi:hypothetical protein